MNLSRHLLDEAAAAGVLSATQPDALWQFLSERDAAHETPSFKPAHILHYLGGLIAIGAMTLFMTLGWERFGAGGLLAISIGYALLAFALAEVLIVRPRLTLAAGITAALGVVMTPLAIYALQHLLGLWPDDASVQRAYRAYHSVIDWRWLLMELATLAVGAIALWRYRLPFLVLPVAVTLWYLSMDLAPFLAGGEPQSMFTPFGMRVSLGSGLVMLLGAVGVDFRSRSARDFAFWLYIFGTLAFWGGLSSLESTSELARLGYAVINLVMIMIGAALSRRVLAVFGGLGVAVYLGHLSHTVFKDSMLFPVALTAIGLALVGVGIFWQRHERTIGKRLRSVFPAALQQMVDRRAV